MEVVLAVIVVVIIVIAVLRASNRADRLAASQSVSVGGNNSRSKYPGMFPIQYRVRDDRLGESGTGPLVKFIEAKGLLPVTRTARLMAITYVFDSETNLPLICGLDDFQEEESLVFRFERNLGQVGPGFGTDGWVAVGMIFPEIIQPPIAGNRRLDITVHFVDTNFPPAIVYGCPPPGHAGLLWSSPVLQGYFEFQGKGYQQESAEREEAQALTVKVGVSIAMVDGGMHDSEGQAIQEWIQKTVSGYSGNRSETVKKSLNQAFKDAFSEASKGQLHISGILKRLREMDDSTSMYRVLQLAFDVLAADGRADEAELHMVESISKSLKLDPKEVERIRDQKLVGLTMSTGSTGSTEAILGIKKGWDRITIRKHLLTEFQKWNGRLAALPEGMERQNAQQMLDMIADLRNKHA